MAGDHAKTDPAASETGPAWLRDSYPGYFALVMATGIVALAAHLMGHEFISWTLFVIALAAYPIFWAILLARLVRFPRSVFADFASHELGPTFLTIVAANGVLGSLFAAFGIFTGLLDVLFWFSAILWAVLVYGFLSLATVRVDKPELEHGLSGAWLLLVVATESLSVLASLLGTHADEPSSLAFAALAFYLLGAMLYVLIAALILLRWVFRPMLLSGMGAPWWINVGAVAIATLAGAHLMRVHPVGTSLTPFLGFVGPFTVMLWVTSTFWIPLLAILFLLKELQHGQQGYDPGLWSAVFPLGMYAAATYQYAAAANFSFLTPIAVAMFWISLLAWVVTFARMVAHFVERN